MHFVRKPRVNILKGRVEVPGAPAATPRAAMNNSRGGDQLQDILDIAAGIHHFPAVFTLTKISPTLRRLSLPRKPSADSSNACRLRCVVVLSGVRRRGWHKPDIPRLAQVSASLEHPHSPLPHPCLPHPLLPPLDPAVRRVEESTVKVAALCFAAFFSGDVRQLT